MLTWLPQGKLRTLLRSWYILVLRIIEPFLRRSRKTNCKILFDTAIAEGDSLLLYAHYHTDEIPEYVWNILHEFYKLNWKIVFVSAGKPLTKKEIDLLKSTCSVLIERENIGYDFGSWKDALMSLPWQKASRIILLNDSVLGPYHPIENLLQKAEKSTADFYGIFESREGKPHLQSFFLYFKKSVLNSEAFEKFWDTLSFYPVWAKPLIVYKYEIGLSDGLLKAGFTFDSLIRYEDYKNKIGKRNPAFYFAQEAVKYFECPFVKKRLLQNPANFGYSKLNFK
ncbi:MAG: hypothetical protein D6767_10325 [Candidatus Hydrogenedentota bacterium]|nr:MAG: hypothetical protein D6767_10325 [Candidatus Hydrogenedentota bacterium]